MKAYYGHPRYYKLQRELDKKFLDSVKPMKPIAETPLCGSRLNFLIGANYETIRRLDKQLKDSLEKIVNNVEKK